MPVPSVNSTTQLHQPQKTSNKRKTIGTLAGATVGITPTAYVLYDSFSPLSDVGAKASAQFMNKLMPEVDTFDNMMDVGNKIMHGSGLDKKGVGIFVSDDTPENNKALDKLLAIMKPKRIREKFKVLFRYGANAAYANGQINKVIINKDRLYSSIPHELGHAMNYWNPATRVLQYSKFLTPFGASIVAPIAVGIALLHRPDKSKSSKDKNKKEKALDFVSNNAGKLTLASYFPLLGEEALASIRGLKAAKKYMDPAKISKLTGNYVRAWGTYGTVAALITASVTIAPVLSDKIKNGFHKSKSKKEIKA